ncbi:unnamed protein product, partial [Protopolystoma xenopodis]
MLHICRVDLWPCIAALLFSPSPSVSHMCSRTHLPTALMKMPEGNGVQETSTVFVTLLYPNIAKDHFGNTGTWTLIYNQGFEVTLSHRKWLVKFDYDRATHKSFCGKGIPGWTHDTLIRQWFCFSAQKIGYTPSLNIVPIAADNQHLGNRFAAPTTKALKELVNQLPKEFDWRSPPGGESVVTSVRDQLECGSCYAFASAAALESRIRI